MESKTTWWFPWVQYVSTIFNSFQNKTTILDVYNRSFSWGFPQRVFQFFRFNPGQAVSPHADAARWWNCMSFTASCQNSLHPGGKRFNPWRTLGHAGRKVGIGQPVSHGVSVILGGFVKQALRFLDVFIRFYSIKQILRRHSLFPEKPRCFCWSFLLADGQVTAVRHMSRWWVYSNQ